MPRGMSDSDPEDADSHLLVDWKGDLAQRVQQKLPFKQVKRCSFHLSPPKMVDAKYVEEKGGFLDSRIPRNSVAAQAGSGPKMRASNRLDQDRNQAVVVSLSDSEPLQAVSRGTKASSSRPPKKPSVTGNVVCLDSDTESDGAAKPCAKTWGAKDLRLDWMDDLEETAQIQTKRDNITANITGPSGEACELIGSKKKNAVNECVIISELSFQAPYGPFPSQRVEQVNKACAEISRVDPENKNCTLDPLGSGRPPPNMVDCLPSSTKNLLSSVPPSVSPFDIDSGGVGSEQTSEGRFQNLSCGSQVTGDGNAKKRPKALLGCIPACESPFDDVYGNDEEDCCEEVNKRRKVPRGQKVSEEDKALERAETLREKLRAKEAERLRKAEEREEKKRQKEESKKQLQEGNRRKREEEKLWKESAKAEARERRKVEHEKNRWEKGKLLYRTQGRSSTPELWKKASLEAAQQCNIAVHCAGHLLSRFAEKHLQFQLVSNPLEKSIIWRMKRPTPDCLEDLESQFLDSEDLDSQSEALGSQNLEAHLGQLVLEEVDVPYVLFILEAEEFANMVAENMLHAHIHTVQKRYPGFTVCYLINKLMWFLQKKDQTQYKHGESGWSRPPIEQALARLVTHFTGVRSRLCLDEAEVADHVTGLMRSLAECPFKSKLTPLSVSKNGDHVQKSDPFKEEIKKSVWLKALVALPKVPGACAMAIAKKYPSMRTLFNSYLDPTKTVHQKELLLEDLLREGLFSSEGSRRVGPACSRRVYRIFMAQNGNLKTDDVEQGADGFHN